MMRPDARRSFELKLAELEFVLGQLKKGDRPKDYFPETVEAFRKWERPGLFGKWTSKTVDAPSGPYPDLSARLRELLAEIKSHSIAGLKETIQRLKKDVSALARQNSEMESLIRELSDKMDFVGKLSDSDRSKIIQLYRR